MKIYEFYESRSGKVDNGKYYKNPMYTVNAESKEEAWKSFHEEDRGSYNLYAKVVKCDCYLRVGMKGLNFTFDELGCGDKPKECK